MPHARQQAFSRSFDCALAYAHAFAQDDRRTIVRGTTHSHADTNRISEQGLFNAPLLVAAASVR